MKFPRSFLTCLALIHVFSFVTAEPEEYLLGQTVQLLQQYNRKWAVWVDAKHNLYLHASPGTVRSSFYVAPGLAGKGISFMMYSDNDRYICASGQSAKALKDDGSRKLAKACTFLPTMGTTSQGGYSFRLFKDPKLFLRTYNRDMRILPMGTKAFPRDSTFLIALAGEEYGGLGFIGKTVRIKSVTLKNQYMYLKSRDFMALRPYANKELAPKFKIVKGLTGEGVSIQYTNKGKKLYLSHRRGWVIAANNIRNANFRIEASWFIRRGFNGRGYAFRLQRHQKYYMIHKNWRKDRKPWMAVSQISNANVAASADFYLV